MTTTDAGMAVPDWPTTYGYNLFLYPLSTWLSGPWDLFVEHGHRLLGALVGMITIVLLAVVWRNDDRHWMRWLAVAALILVIFQGILGGLRVRLDERTLAMLHGCTGPLFFAATIAMTTFTSKRWLVDSDAPSLQESERGRGGSYAHIRRLAVVTCILVYLQIVLGAVIRHVPVAAEPGTFVLAVRFHLFLAAILTLHITLLVWSVVRHACGIRPLRGLAVLLVGLLAVQLKLGVFTWLTKFAAPVWAPSWLSVNRLAIQDGGWTQTHIITAHVAVGSLVLATSLALALYSLRLLPAASNNASNAIVHSREVAV